MIDSDTGLSFAGIADDTTWNFSTLPGDPLLMAVAALKDHINGVITLSAAEIEAHKLTIDAQKARFDENDETFDEFDETFDENSLFCYGGFWFSLFYATFDVYELFLMYYDEAFIYI